MSIAIIMGMRPETIEVGANILAGADPKRISESPINENKKIEDDLKWLRVKRYW